MLISGDTTINAINNDKYHWLYVYHQIENSTIIHTKLLQCTLVLFDRHIQYLTPEESTF